MFYSLCLEDKVHCTLYPVFVVHESKQIKNNSTIIFGSLAFIESIGWLAVLIWIFFDRDLDSRSIEEMLLWISGFLPVASTLVYLFKTRFWKKKISDHEKIELENQLIKKQIEQKELKLRLNELENKLN